MNVTDEVEKQNNRNIEQSILVIQLSESAFAFLVFLSQVLSQSAFSNTILGHIRFDFESHDHSTPFYGSSCSSHLDEHVQQHFAYLVC